MQESRVKLSVAWDGCNELWQFRAGDELAVEILTEEKNALGCMASAESGPIVVYVHDGVVLLKKLLARNVLIEGGPQDADDRASGRRELKGLVARAERIVDDGALDWETRYDRVFAGAPRIRELLRELGMPVLTYYDPDSSYEEDTMAYVSALREQVAPALEERAA